MRGCFPALMSRLLSGSCGRSAVSHCPSKQLFSYIVSDPQLRCAPESKNSFDALIQVVCVKVCVCVCLTPGPV